MTDVATSTAGNRPPEPPDHGLAPRPVERPGATRRLVVAVLSLLLVASAITGLSIAGSRRPSTPPVHRARMPTEAARADARAFLQRYVTPDGRVARRDQHGDTVSEGQAYALLLAVATGERRTFATVWQWERAHLQEADGLFAYHWQGGRVVAAEPATDADLDTAWALVRAGTRFGDPTYRTQGLRVASAVLADETDVVAGRLTLMAGPWARKDPAVVNPSYLAPEAMAALGRASRDPRWSVLAASATAITAALAGRNPARLPPNWADVEPDGAVRPVGSPSGSGTPAYSLDAQRAPVWLAASCSRADRSLAARYWPVLGRTSARGARVSYTLAGRSTARAVNPLGLVAAAAATRAAGHRALSASLLDAADRQSDRAHTYYGDAWAALGRVLLDTPWLASCPNPALEPGGRSAGGSGPHPARS